MADRRAVVILDDAAGPEQVRPLLPGASPSLVVITSRRRLTGLADVRPLSLDVLPLPDAVALFRRRVGPDRPLGDEEAAEIVRLCGRLPLAVDIVASRFVSRPAWTAADLVRRLARSGGRLTEIRDAHRGIIAVFEFSHRALTEVQRTAFRRLGLYIGSDFGLHAAAALTDMPVEDADRVLEDLLNCHLLVETSPHRYRMHDLLREFARALMADEAERRRAVDRLLGHYLHTADAADRVVYPHRVRMDVACGGTGPVPAGWSGRAESREWFTSEGRNLLAVLEHVRAHRPSGELAALSHVLAGFLEAEGYWATAEPVLRRAAEHWRSLGDPTAEARALLDLGAVCMRTGAYEAAIESAGRAARLARENGEPEVEAEALHQSGLAFWHSGRSLSALPRQKRALSLRMRGRNTLQQARSLNVMGIVLLHLGRTGESIELFREAVSGFRSADDSRGLYQALNNMGEAHRATGAERLAERCYREAVDLAGAAGSAVDRATLQMNLASFAMDSGRADEALLLYREALPVFHGVGDRRNESITHNGIGRALRSTGRRDEAVLWCRAALELARSIGASNEEVQALRELGLAEWEAGRERRAVELLEAGLSLARRIHAPGEEVKLEKTLDVLRVDHGSSASAKGRGKEPSVEGEAPG